jgi:hypothetical protein
MRPALHLLHAGRGAGLDSAGVVALVVAGGIIAAKAGASDD